MGFASHLLLSCCTSESAAASRASFLNSTGKLKIEDRRAAAISCKSESTAAMSAAAATGNSSRSLIPCSSREKGKANGQKKTVGNVYPKYSGKEAVEWTNIN